jgi:triosephosphate isomerase
MLKSVGVQYVIIGHSERRQYFNETNAQLAEKINLLLTLSYNLSFVWQSLEQREKGYILILCASN